MTPRTRALGLGGLSLGIALIASSTARAQEAMPPAPVAAVVHEFVPVPQIPERIESLQHVLRGISETVAADPAVTAIQAKLRSVEEQTSLRVAETDSLLAGGPGLEDLRDEVNDWSARLKALSGQRQTLSVRAAALEGELVGLQEMTGLWSRSLVNARDSQAPDEVLRTVESNLASIAAVTARVKERRAAVLTLLTAVSELELRASESYERIALARATLRSRLFEPDSKPLWSALGSGASRLSAAPVRSTVSAEWDEFVEFVAVRRHEFPPLVVLFFLALAVALFVRERMRRRAEEPRLEGSAAVFERPASVAALVAATLAVGAFPFAPGLVRDLLGVLLLFPVARVLLPVVPQSARAIIGLVAAFYLVDRLRDVLEPAELLERLVFLGEVLVAAASITWLLRPSRLRAMPSSSASLPFLGAGLRLAVFAFVVSAFANAFGYLSFGRVIGDGTLGSIYLALLFYASYRIVTTLGLVAVTSARLEVVGVVRNNRDALLRWMGSGVALLAVGLWANGTLEEFAIRDVVLERISWVLFTPFDIGTVSLSIGSILAFPATVLVAIVLSKALRSILEEDVFSRVTLRRGIGNAVTTSVHYGLLLGGIFIALGAAGIDLSKFALLAGALGVGIGFGLQNVVNNFVSGLILLYERPVQVGDTIELGGMLGQVKRIGIRASTVLTFQGAEVIIPNGNLLSEQLTNWTLSNKHRRVEVPIGVAYGNHPTRVARVLGRALDGDERILRDPAPVVLFRGFGDSSLDFELRFWARDYMTYLQLASDVASAVYDELEREGIAVPFPQRDLHLKSVDAGAAEKLRGGDENS